MAWINILRMRSMGVIVAHSGVESYQRIQHDKLPLIVVQIYACVVTLHSCLSPKKTF